ncbi:MAG: hypothetical protein LBH05_02445 [Deferribacteraceae bacterium]|jgi:Zn-dependent M32 family carboxypeptidase|nr:hypothetical protein [Deferribacteraceae bacterium]
MAYSSELREHAFEVWYRRGQNDSETVRELDKEGYVVTRKTVSEWREKYNWEGRATRLDEKKQGAADTSMTFDEELLLDLLKNKERYEAYFDSLEPGKVDNQAQYVYMQVCKQIRELKKEIKPKEKAIKRGLKADTAEEIKKQILGME